MEELGCGEGFHVRRAKLVPCVLLRTAGKTWRMTERGRGREGDKDGALSAQEEPPALVKSAE